MKNKAVILDRDGTINPDPGYISRPEDFKLYPGTGKALAKLKAAGYLLCIASNQAGIARGLITPAQLKAVHRRMEELLADDGVILDKIYFCPHHPDYPGKPGEQPCECRKPAPGMALKAISDFSLDRTRSFVVGDRDSDMLMAQNAGLNAVLITDQENSCCSLLQGQKNGSKKIWVVRNLSEAVDLILKLETSFKQNY